MLDKTLLLCYSQILASSKHGPAGSYSMRASSVGISISHMDREAWNALPVKGLKVGRWLLLKRMVSESFDFRQTTGSMYVGNSHSDMGPAPSPQRIGKLRRETTSSTQFHLLANNISEDMIGLFDGQPTCICFWLCTRAQGWSGFHECLRVRMCACAVKHWGVSL